MKKGKLYKIISVLYFIMLLLILISCKKEVALQDEPILNNETKKLVITEETESGVVIDKKTQEDFNRFFKLFNHDTNFQISRIQFPLKVMINNDDLELVDYAITKEKYTPINLDKKDEDRDYKQTLILNKDKAVIQQRGLNNGIFIDYFFEKIQGEWKLVTWIDVST
ncbi:DUF4348 domain-containing protein [Flavobacterium sp. LS1R49]|uniref:DUF4348 domain-containing protein n=1 Tax=Flavobacterium shii TaxID=2987687 RepID=A0A9X2ZH74_9FLAO|nr:DUF4348 domain-containing protein [Flavobacterium shii]MCV9927638.1 DUF4348 domain-containing protein [Flavobacterium shii]